MTTLGGRALAILVPVTGLGLGAILVGCAPDSADASPSGGGGGGASTLGAGGTAGVAGGGGATGSTGSTSAVGGSGGATVLNLPDATAFLPDAPLAVDSGCEGVRDTRPVAPNVLVVLDRSGSMLHEGLDRWTPAVSAVAVLTGRLEDRVQFGLAVFPLVTDAPQNCTAGEVRLPPRLHQSAAIVAELNGPSAPLRGGGTPTSSTLAVARDALSGLPGSSYVLLVTDGAPNCNGAADTTSCTCTRSPVEYCRGGDPGIGAEIEPQPTLCLDDAASVAAIEALATAGIRTLVIGYDTTAWSSTLDAMASAGGTGRSTHYPVSDGTALQAALEEASAFVVACTFELTEPPPSDRYVSVEIDAVRLSHVSQTGGSSGWRLVGDRTVELVGDTCRAVSDGMEHDIVIVRECEAVVR